MDEITSDLIRLLPKTDLHCHLDGSLRISTLIELAKQQGLRLPSEDPAALMASLKYGQIRQDLNEYLYGFEPLIKVLQSEKNLKRVVYELCADAASENVWHLEMRYCPYLNTKEGLTLNQVVEACLEASQEAKQNLGISVGHILCGLKQSKSANILEVAHLAARYKNEGVVGFDLAGPEDGYPIRDHLEAIYIAKKNHLFITLHAGESYGPSSIAQAIFDAGAHRIGHGTSLAKDPDLLAYVINHRIGIECCPLSNLHTGAVKSLADHPLKFLLKSKARVSINTDNRLCSDTSVTKEIVLMAKALNLSLEDIKSILINGFKSAFVSYDKRLHMLSNFNLVWDDLITKKGINENG